MAHFPASGGMQTVLVTGASGFVGRTLLGMARAGEFAGTARMLALPDGVDLRDAESVKRALEGSAPDAVIHLAALSFVPDSIARPLETYAVNLHGTINLLDALAAAGFHGAFLCVSSGDVYGAVPADALPIDEDRTPMPRNPYAASKLAAEAYCCHFSQGTPIRMLVARPFNHIGPGQSERFAVAGFAKQISEIKRGHHAPVIEAGNVDVTRDFCDVRDVVRAYLALLEKGIAGGTYNVCSGVERHLGGILQRMLELSGVTASVKGLRERFRPYEQTRHCGSNRKLCKDTGWAPRVTFEKSLQDLLESWDKRPING